MSGYLIVNDDILILDYLSLNTSMADDTLGGFSKGIICFASSLYFFIVAYSFKKQLISSFESILIVAFAILGLMLLCTSNDLLTAYLVIELKSLSSYLWASFRKTSIYSLDAGIKYLIAGAMSSSLYLLGSSLTYAFSSSIYFIDYWDFISSVGVQSLYKRGIYKFWLRRFTL
jgi:NADH-quinone oxidoreductase subunit N